jgi:hypothetical protein
MSTLSFIDADWRQRLTCTKNFTQVSGPDKFRSATFAPSASKNNDLAKFFGAKLVLGRLLFDLTEFGDFNGI